MTYFNATESRKVLDFIRAVEVLLDELRGGNETTVDHAIERVEATRSELYRCWP